jgi:hypothetical protein
MSDVRFDGDAVTVDGDANFLTAHGGNSHFGYGNEGSAYLSYGASGVLVIRTFDGINYSDKAHVDASGQVDLFSGRGGNTHFGYGANGDAFLSFGGGGHLTIRTFDGANYRKIVRVSGKGQVDLLTGPGGNTHFGYGPAGDAYLSFGAGGNLTIRAFDGANYRDVVRVSGAGVTINGAVNMPSGATVSGKNVAALLDSLTAEINALKARVAALESGRR